jgi:hypothetical protein
MWHSTIKGRHESAAHIADKAEYQVLAPAFGYEHTFIEEHFADAVSVCQQHVLTVGFEYSAKNVIPNCNRDLVTHGADFGLILCPNFNTFGAVARKLDRELAIPLRERIALATMLTLRILNPQNKLSRPQ